MWGDMTRFHTVDFFLRPQCYTKKQQPGQTGITHDFFSKKDIILRFDPKTLFLQRNIVLDPQPGHNLPSLPPPRAPRTRLFNVHTSISRSFSQRCWPYYC